MSAALLLAAGEARRFGSDKRLHPLPDGRPILLACAETYLAVFDTLWVVTKPHEPHIAALLQTTNAQMLQADGAKLGMGYSLAEAVQSIRRHYRGSLFVGLADMPYVAPTTLRLCEAQLHAVATQEKRVIQPRYQQQPGNPVGFSAAIVDQLTQCTGDQGARGLIREARQAGQVSYVDVADPGILHDIDTPSALST